MRYHLKIEDCSSQGAPRGEAVCVIAEGEFCGGVFTLNYPFDGARYVLKICGNCVYHQRIGDTQMMLEFRQGEKTHGTLKSGEMCGSLDIYTHELKTAVTANGCSVRLVYSDFADSKLLTVKNITAYQVK